MLRCTLAVILLSPALLGQSSVQPVSASGRIESVPGPTICNQAVTHKLECTDVFLISTTVDLNAFTGMLVEVTGTQVGVTCTVIQVTGVAIASPTLETCGTPAPGCPLRFKICPSGAVGVHFLFAAAAPGFFPVSVMQGSLLLTPPLLLISTGFQGFPCTTIDLTVPPINQLVGIDVFLQGALQDIVFLQGALQDIGPIGPPILTNSICFKILPATVPCQLPSC